MTEHFMQINLTRQELKLYADDQCKKIYAVSTAKNGAGERMGSECTPRGRFKIRAKIGAGKALNTVFKGRRPTGEIYTDALALQYPERDWILTRILWISGLEPGFNRFGDVDTMRRFIYIHGTPDSQPMGIPLSHGCIRMRNTDIVELFDIVAVGTLLSIES